MKCPKCNYLGFEPADRCRNCGYDFSLMPVGELELDMRHGSQSMRPLEDLALVDSAAAPRSAAAMLDAGPDLDRVFGEPAPAFTKPPMQELPLFGPPIPDDDRPLITKVSPPRMPVSVRRATSQVPRVRSEQPRMTPFELALETETPDEEQVVPAFARTAHATDAQFKAPHAIQPTEVEAGVLARFMAVAIDATILALIDTAVIYFTLQICGVSVADLGIVPKGPLLAFLLVQNGGYMVAFTAGGQTLGKMAAGIRVVASESNGSLDLGRAFLRTLMWLLLAVPAGLGFFTALFGRDHRGLHDRFAGTRVVRSAA